MSFRVKRGILSLDYESSHKDFSVIAPALPYLLHPCSRPAGQNDCKIGYIEVRNILGRFILLSRSICFITRLTYRSARFFCTGF